MLRFLGFLLALIVALYYTSYQSAQRQPAMSPIKNVAIIGVRCPPVISYSESFI